MRWSARREALQLVAAARDDVDGHHVGEVADDEVGDVAQRAAQAQRALGDRADLGQQRGSRVGRLDLAARRSLRGQQPLTLALLLTALGHVAAEDDELDAAPRAQRASGDVDGGDRAVGALDLGREARVVDAATYELGDLLDDGGAARGGNEIEVGADRA